MCTICLLLETLKYNFFNLFVEVYQWRFPRHSEPKSNFFYFNQINKKYKNINLLPSEYDIQSHYYILDESNFVLI